MAKAFDLLCIEDASVMKTRDEEKRTALLYAIVSRRATLKSRGRLSIEDFKEK
jgi:hypothetical protein